MLRPIMDVARELASAHREYDPRTTTIKLFPHAQQNEIHLLEVSDAVPTVGETLPFRFGSDVAYGIDYPSVVILLSQDDWHSVKIGNIDLPDGWNLPEAQDL